MVSFFFPGGEPVEGFTSPLWFLWLAAGAVFHLSLPTLAYFSGILASIVTIPLTIYIATLLSSKEVQPARITYINLLFTGLILVTDFTYLGWSASGMESSAYALFQLVLLLLLLKSANEIWIGAILFLLSLIRPEGVMFLFPVLFWLFWQKKITKASVTKLSSTFILPYLLFLCFRFWYFGDLLPNTFYAKHSFNWMPLLTRGFFYIYTFCLPRPLFLFAIFWLLLQPKRQYHPGFLVFIFLIWNLLLVILDGGDHFAMHRFLLPAIPFFAILVPQGIYLCLERLLKEKTDTHWAESLCFVVCLLLPYEQHIMIRDYQSYDYYYFSKGVQWLVDEAKWSQSWVKLGTWLKEKYPPGTQIAVTTAGAIPYASELPCLDILGINDRTIAHSPATDAQFKFPGHDKSNPDYVLSHKPRFIQLFPLLFFSSSPYPEKRMDEMITYPAQRDIWNNPIFRQNYIYKTEQTKYGCITYYELINP